MIKMSEIIKELALIAFTQKEKKKRYPEDRRIVVVCGIRDDNVHVEWCAEKDYPEALELAQRRLEKEIGHTAIQLGK